MDLALYNDPEVGHQPMTLKFKLNVKSREEIEVIGYTSHVTFHGISAPYSTFTLDHERFSPNSGHTIELEVHLPPFIIEEIERRRMSGDVSTSIQLRFLRLGSGPHPLKMEYASLAHSLRISERQWLKLLEGLGWGTRAIFALPLPTLPMGSGLRKAAEHLENAKRSLESGDNDAAITSCRKAMEATNPIVSTQSGSQSAMLTPLAAAVDLGSAGESDRPAKSARYEALRRSLWTLLHIGPHEMYHVTRADAEFCVHATLSLISFYGAHLQRLESNMGSSQA